MELALPSRVSYTEDAADLLRSLTADHGALMFHQSGGCCDGSSPMCYLDGEFRVGSADILLGRLEISGIERPIDVWMSRPQFEYWKHTHLTIDVVDGRGGGFSLESPEGKRFLIRSRIFSDDECKLLETATLVTGAT
jgi:uncharacterized protein (DUF779 family)